MIVLVLAAHADDELLGPGGTLIRHSRSGDAVHVAYCVGRPNLKMYSSARYGGSVLAKRKRQAERVGKLLGFRSVRCLGLKDELLEQNLSATVTALEEAVAKTRPDVVYLHHGGDANQDHRGVFKAGLVALRPYLRPLVRRVLCFETPSSTESAPPRAEWQFHPNVYSDITKTLEKKLEALRIYADEMKPFPHPRSYEALRALAAVRGAASGYNAAEAFELVRESLSEPGVSGE